MPQIPQFTEHQRLEVNNPVSVDDSRDARDSGEAISALGQGLTRLGAGLADHEQESKRQQRLRDVNEARQAAATAAIEEVDHINREGPTDGQGWMKIYNERLSKRINDIALNFDDPVTKQEVFNAANEQRNRYLDNVQSAGVARSTEHGRVQLENITNGGAALVRSDGRLFESELLKVQDVILKSDRVSTPEERHKMAYEAAPREFSRALLQNLKNQNKFNEARKVLNTKLAPYFNAEELEKQRDDINNEQYQVASRDYIEQERKANKAEKQHKLIMDANMRSAADLAFQANNSGDRNVVRRQAERLFTSGQIEESQYKFLDKILDEKVKNIDDDELFIKLSDEIAFGKPSPDLHRDIVKYVNSDQLKATSARQLFNDIQEEKNRRKSDPAYKEENSNAKEFVKSQFTPGMMDFDRSKVIEQQGHAIREYNRLKKKPGYTPDRAAIEAVSRFKGKAFTVPYAPGLPPFKQSSVEGIDQLLKELQEKAKQAKSKDEIMSILGQASMLENKKKQLQLDEMKKLPRKKDAGQ